MSSSNIMAPHKDCRCACFLNIFDYCKCSTKGVYFIFKILGVFFWRRALNRDCLFFEKYMKTMENEESLFDTCQSANRAFNYYLSFSKGRSGELYKSSSFWEAKTRSWARCTRQNDCYANCKKTAKVLDKEIAKRRIKFVTLQLMH